MVLLGAGGVLHATRAFPGRTCPAHGQPSFAPDAEKVERQSAAHWNLPESAQRGALEPREAPANAIAGRPRSRECSEIDYSIKTGSFCICVTAPALRCTLRGFMIYTILKRVPGGHAVQVFTGVCLVIGIACAPVLYKKTAAGHDLFSSEKPAAVERMLEKRQEAKYADIVKRS